MTYEEEQKELLKSVISRYDKPSAAVEFIISSSCNQACEYCYYYKYGTELYPPEVNQKEKILHNLPLLLDWLEEEKYQYKSYDLFSGEFFALPYWEDVLKIFYEHNKKIGCPDRGMTIPTNLSWVSDENKYKKVTAWFKIFEEVNIRLFMSCSVDGPSWLENKERPLHVNKKEEKFFDKIFEFCREYNAGFHPMITKEFVSHYKENYDWWIAQMKKHNLMLKKRNSYEKVYDIPMFLEVRDNEQWDTQEALDNYRDFLFYIAETDLRELHNNDLESFAYHMLDDFTPDTEDLGTYNHLQPYLIGLPNLYSHMGCTVQQGSMFRVGDLALVPCHRTAYPNFIHGYLVLNEEGTKIIDIKPNNVLLDIKIKTFNPNRSMLKCSDCSVKLVCMKGCFGSQYEHNKELFSTQENVCKMQKVKLKTIHEIAEKYGIYDMAKTLFGLSDKRREVIAYERKVLNEL